MDTTIGSIIFERREALGLTQPDLAARIGKTTRQIRRYEDDDQEPTVATCRHLAVALSLSLAQLLGETPIGLDLSGKWCAAWQTTRKGKPVIDRHGITASHIGGRVVLSADGDYLWSGDLGQVDGSLMGTYRSTERDALFRGALYFDLAEDATAMIGRWSGRWADGILGRDGFGVIARDSARADRLLTWLMTHDGPITEWPQED